MEDDQICRGRIAIANQSGDEGHPTGVELWLVASDGDRFRATPETARALARDVNPGDAVFVPIKFTPPADLVFRGMDVEASGDQVVSVRLFAGEGAGMVGSSCLEARRHVGVGQE